MAFTELELRRCEKKLQRYIEAKRPPPNIRPKLDLGYRISGQSVVIFEIRPRCDNPSETIEEYVAKATYVRRANAWRVYWQRADLKWHGYTPTPEVRSVEDFLALVEEDKFCCFFG